MPKYKISELIEYVTEMQEDRDLEWGVSKEEHEKCEEIEKRLIELDILKGE